MITSARFFAKENKRELIYFVMLWCLILWFLCCVQEKLMGHLGVVLYEYLGEEYPEVLGSILGALKAIVNVIGMTKMTPPIKDLLPRLTPILKNRHEKVSCGEELVYFYYSVLLKFCCDTTTCLFFLFDIFVFGVMIIDHRNKTQVQQKR